jgi:hypothetical protein
LNKSDRWKYTLYAVSTLVTIAVSVFEAVTTKDLLGSMIIGTGGAIIVIYLITILLFEGRNEDSKLLKSASHDVKSLAQYVNSILTRMDTLTIEYQSKLSFKVLDRAKAYSNISSQMVLAKNRIMVIQRTPAIFFPVKKTSPGAREESTFIETLKTVVIPRCKKKEISFLYGFNHLDSTFVHALESMDCSEIDSLIQNAELWDEYSDSANIRLFSFADPSSMTLSGMAALELVDDWVFVEIITLSNARWKISIKDQRMADELFEKYSSESAVGIQSAIDYLKKLPRTKADQKC